MERERSVDLAIANGGSLRGLSERESELVTKAGERVFELSRRLGERERELAQLKAEINSLRQLLEETTRSREVLASQIIACQSENDRNYQERVELRQLLGSAQTQLQNLVQKVLVEGAIGGSELPDPLAASSKPKAVTATSRSGTVKLARRRVRRWLRPLLYSESESRTQRTLGRTP